ncbi:uncharacterized protein PAC_03571 [Phialocephala subalpina]|uniref:Uncharacterized protein n=1 Tax=Phialocephala subalpina TaxID=576137 RepID=A0A1L7WLN4_9HELO|nr:uncharacterized protein PAC_03571 [Phialocephala subalpina]
MFEPFDSTSNPRQMSPSRVLKSTSPKKAAPSVSQLLFFEVIFANMNGKLDVDWAAVAHKAGYGPGPIARIRFNQIINKLKAINNDGSPRSSPTNSPSTKPQASPPRATNITADEPPTKPKLPQRKKNDDAEVKKGRGRVVSIEGGVVKREVRVKEERLFDDMVSHEIEFKAEDYEANFA